MCIYVVYIYHMCMICAYKLWLASNSQPLCLSFPSPKTASVPALARTNFLRRVKPDIELISKINTSNWWTWKLGFCFEMSFSRPPFVLCGQW